MSPTFPKRCLIAVAALLVASSVSLGASGVAVRADGAPAGQSGGAPAAAEDRSRVRLLAAVDAARSRGEIVEQLLDATRRIVVRENRIGTRSISRDGDKIRLLLRDSSKSADVLAKLDALREFADISIDGVAAGASPSSEPLIIVALRDATFERRLEIFNDRAVELLRRRARILGMKSASVKRDSGSAIRFEMDPGDYQRLLGTFVCGSGFTIRRLIPQVAEAASDSSAELVASAVDSGLPGKLAVEKRSFLDSGDLVDARVAPGQAGEEPTIEYEPDITGSLQVARLPDVSKDRFAIVIDGRVVAITRIAPLASGRYGLTLIGLTFEKASELAAIMRELSPGPTLVSLAETNVPRADNPSKLAPK